MSAEVANATEAPQAATTQPQGMRKNGVSDFFYGRTERSNIS